MPYGAGWPVRLRRLLYRSGRAGILENGLILSSFAREHLPALSPQEADDYERLLCEDDWEVYHAVAGRRDALQRFQGTAILQRLQRHAAEMRRNKELRA